MSSGPRLLLPLVAATTAFLLVGSARAAEPDADRFKAGIDAVIGQLALSSNGAIRWIGSGSYEVRRDGDDLVATIDNARLSLEAQQTGELTLDHLEVREIGRHEEGDPVERRLTLPKSIVLRSPDGGETKISLEGASAKAISAASPGRGRETLVEVASARIDQPRTGAWVSLGPLSVSYKLVAKPDGDWSAPVEFELRGIEYFLPQGPLGGVIERIAFTGGSDGPRLSELDRLREAFDRVESNADGSSQTRAAAFLATLPTLSAPFSSIRGELSVQGVRVGAATGETLIAVAKAGAAAEITGLDSEQAALRLTVRQDGLDLAPSLLESDKVPRQVALDFGVSNLSTRALTNLLDALVGAADHRISAERETEPNNIRAVQRTLGAAAMLNPLFQIHEIAIDTEEIGIALTAEVKGSPLTPSGYQGSADLAVRGFDSIPKLGDEIPFAQYLPVLREIGVESTAPDGKPRLKFHFSSAPANWIMVNSNDVSAWFSAREVEAGRPRVLTLSDPPMRGDDVRSVQRALAAENISVDQDGEYSPATAGAVARFQRENGLNVSGIVDVATRARLGGLGDPMRQGGRN